MNFKKKVLFVFVILISNIYIPISHASVTFFQTSKVNSNSTMTITITYGAKESEIKKSNNIIGSLPFTAETVKEYFSFPGGEIKKSAIYKDQKDASITNVTVDLFVKDLSKLTSSKALNGIKIGYSKSDTGIVFSWLIPNSFMQTNSVDTYQFLLTVDGELKSSNGIIKDKVCNWYIYKDKMNPGGAYFLTTFKANPNPISSGDTPKDTTSKGNEKSCGLFGLELPLIMLLGLIFNKSLKRKDRH